jgi:hypothetical protein
MVEVGGSNPPGPTKIENPPLGGFFGFGGVGLDENRCSTNATSEAFGPPERRGGARRVKASEAMALEDNPPGPTKIKNPPLGEFLGFGGIGLDENRCSTNATSEVFGPPERRGGARRVKAPEASALATICLNLPK